MKKTLSYTFGVLLILFVAALGKSAYTYYVALHADDPLSAYVSVLEGKVTITRDNSLAIDLEKPESYHIKEKDIIIVQEDSEAKIFWPDHSTTHLGPNSRLTIEKMQIAFDYSSIELVTSLEQGKIWSNVVRTLYPGSQFSIKLPNQGLVAGVRGTSFEINTEKGNGYIYSEDHVVNVQNRLYQNVALLPGKALSLGNIFMEISKDQLDLGWQEMNRLQDTLYNSERAKKLEKTWDTLSGNLAYNNYWDRLVRYILSHLRAFKQLKIVETIQGLDVQALQQIPQEYLLGWYQKIKGVDMVEQRDAIRGAFEKILESSNKSLDEYWNFLLFDAYYDVREFPNALLGESRTLLEKVNKKMQEGMEKGWKQINEGGGTPSESINIFLEKIFESKFIGSGALNLFRGL